jgi:hypothetical protein
MCPSEIEDNYFYVIVLNQIKKLARIHLENSDITKEIMRGRVNVDLLLYRREVPPGAPVACPNISIGKSVRIIIPVIQIRGWAIGSVRVHKVEKTGCIRIFSHRTVCHHGCIYRFTVGTNDHESNPNPSLHCSSVHHVRQEKPQKIH